MLLDISAGSLQPVQRFHVDDGPVSAIAARLTARQLYELSSAQGPRGLDGGGVVGGPVGLPWRLPPYAEDADAGSPKGVPMGSLSRVCPKAWSCRLRRGLARQHGIRVRTWWACALLRPSMLLARAPQRMSSISGWPCNALHCAADTLLAVASAAGWLAVYQPLRAGERAWEKMFVGSVTGHPLLAFSPDGSHLALASGARQPERAASSAASHTCFTCRSGEPPAGPAECSYICIAEVYHHHL